MADIICFSNPCGIRGYEVFTNMCLKQVILNIHEKAIKLSKRKHRTLAEIQIYISEFYHKKPEIITVIDSFYKKHIVSIEQDIVDLDNIIQKNSTMITNIDLNIAQDNIFANSDAIKYVDDILKEYTKIKNKKKLRLDFLEEYFISLVKKNKLHELDITKMILVLVSYITCWPILDTKMSSCKDLRDNPRIPEEHERAWTRLQILDVELTKSDDIIHIMNLVDMVNTAPRRLTPKIIEESRSIAVYDLRGLYHKFCKNEKEIGFYHEINNIDIVNKKLYALCEKYFRNLVDQNTWKQPWINMRRKKSIYTPRERGFIDVYEDDYIREKYRELNPIFRSILCNKIITHCLSQIKN